MEIARIQTMNSRALGLAGGARSRVAPNYHFYFVLFLGLCYFPTVTWPRRREVTSTRSNIDARLPREGKLAICSADDAASLPEACRTRLPPPLDTLSYFFLTLLVLSRFPSALICLFHRVSVDDMQNPRESTEIGFRFICNFRLRILWFLYSCIRVFRVSSYTIERDWYLCHSLNFRNRIRWNPLFFFFSCIT